MGNDKMNQNTILAWKYHDLTKHSYLSVRATPHYLDWDNKPSPFKIYPDITPESLPQEFVRTDTPALEAVASTESSGETRLGLTELASLLYYSAGITKKKSYPSGEFYFRAAACAGALYPIETYLVCGDIGGLKAGVYHFDPKDFALRRLREGDHRGSLAQAAAGEPSVVMAQAILVYTAITWRSAWKYRDRSYRYHFWDNGMIAANALAVASTLNLPAKIILGFTESEVNHLLGIDGRRELALSLLPIGRSEAEITVRKDLPELNLRTQPLSKAEVDYPSIRDMHDASSLTESESVALWREATIELKPPEPAGELFPLARSSKERLHADAIDDVIRRRASTRRFAHKPISFAELSVILDRATRGIPADFLQPAGMQLNDLYLIINSVEGLRSGAYFYRREDRALEQLTAGEFREKAAYLALGQELAGDASATIFFMADLKPLLEGFGNRGYRVAQMEAAIIGGKIYLAAYAIGRGATGLTFYDDDVTDFFSPHAEGKSCIFVTSIGVPGKRPIY